MARVICSISLVHKKSVTQGRKGKRVPSEQQIVKTFFSEIDKPRQLMQFLAQKGSQFGKITHQRAAQKSLQYGKWTFFAA